MGREIRMVPENWNHPKTKRYDYKEMRYCEVYQPMHDEPYIEALKEWTDNHELWEKGKHPDQDKKYKYYAQYGGDPPSIEYYRPNWKPKQMTWYQMYETVSEGTPVTPAFKTKKELVEYLVENGDFWDQKRGHGGWKRESAEKFVNIGWSPSGMISNKGEFKTARDL